MVRYLTLLAFCVLFVNQSHSQKITGSFVGGLSTSQIDGDLYEGFNKLGLFAGFGVSTYFTPVVGVKTELYYIGKGAKKNANGVEVYKTKLHYIELPFYCALKPLKEVEIDLGFSGSYLINGKLFEAGAEVPDGLSDLNNFDFGAIISASYFFTGSVGLNVRFNYSLIPVKNNPNWYNSNLSFGVIYLINSSK